jgi:hypothetical protein
VAAGVVPRMLSCGHAFCEACLAQMLRCAGITRASPQRLSLVAGRLCTITTGPGWWAGCCRLAGLGSGWSARRAGRNVRSRAGARRSCQSCTTCRGRSNKRSFNQTR